MLFAVEVTFGVVMLPVATGDGTATGAMTGAITGVVAMTHGGIFWAWGNFKLLQLRFNLPGVERFGPIHKPLLAHFCNEKPAAVQALDSLTTIFMDVIPLAAPFLAVNEPSYDMNSITFPLGSFNAIPSTSLAICLKGTTV